MRLRNYQQEAIDSTIQKLNVVRSALLVMATGLGKSVCFSHLAKYYKKFGRIMAIAHREELIMQAKGHFDRDCDTNSDIEMGELFAGHSMFKADIVVSTIQSQISGRDGGRMTRFDPKDFSLLIIDEAHHVCADTYKRVINYYTQNPNLKVLGVTATPDRADELALGQIFEAVAYQYDIWDGITDGWLVPISQQSVYVQGLDYSTVRTTAGDLNGKDLAAILEFEENLHAISHPCIELCGDKKTLVFAASVAQAERLAEIINRHKPEQAKFVCGKTPTQVRRDMFRDYADGEFQYLVNVGIATEGWDGPDVQIVVMARPTKSRSLYTQIAGRGTRPLTGIVDGIEDAIDRRDAIEKSGKPFLTIIDFVGNSGRHKLVTSADILGGKYSDEVVALAKSNAQKKKKPTDIATELQQAEREIAHRRRAEEEAELRKQIKPSVKYRISSGNPFDILDISPMENSPGHKDKQPTQKQVDYLAKYGVNTDGLSYLQARQLVTEVLTRFKQSKCTYKQASWLARFDFPTDLTFDQAKPFMDAIANTTQWGRRPMPEQVRVQLNTLLAKWKGAEA
jgi:superfamily II DNA or RNA helicase